ncbi:hypothetical protein RRG08_040199 [Elysia crispata]|uniref:Uncharacterized protein n=1 Tax=Elysia crispata TaxID=231223 RepID=A0AAE0XYK6_9GAST|nr:hypothetical protein RRG08_040199 [Elysia crispata]
MTIEQKCSTGHGWGRQHTPVTVAGKNRSLKTDRGTGDGGSSGKDRGRVPYWQTSRNATLLLRTFLQLDGGEAISPLTACHLPPQGKNNPLNCCGLTGGRQNEESRTNTALRVTLGNLGTLESLGEVRWRVRRSPRGRWRWTALWR